MMPSREGFLGCRRHRGAFEAGRLVGVFLHSTTILLASYLQSVPIATSGPLLPPIGFLFLLGWRLLRPGVLPIWSGLIFGIWDDLFSGQPFGSAIFLLSAAMLLAAPAPGAYCTRRGRRQALGRRPMWRSPSLRHAASRSIWRWRPAPCHPFCRP